MEAFVTVQIALIRCIIACGSFDLFGWQLIVQWSLALCGRWGLVPKFASTLEVNYITDYLIVRLSLQTLRWHLKRLSSQSPVQSLKRTSPRVAKLRTKSELQTKLRRRPRQEEVPSL